MLIFLFLPLTKGSTFSKYFHCWLKTGIKSVREYKSCQADLKLGKDYDGKLKVDEASDETKTNPKLTVFM